MNYTFAVGLMTAPSANLLRDLLLAFARRTALERGVVDLRAREQLRLINGLAKEIIGRKNPAEITITMRYEVESE